MTGAWSSVPKRVKAGEPAEASFFQERLWFMEKLSPGSCAFNMLNGFMIAGSLDRELVERSIREIVRRHESLRTNLVFSEGKVLQQVSQPSPKVFEAIDLTRLPEERRLEEADRMATALARRPYDLAADPLFKTVLFELGGEKRLLAVLSHHAVFDGWSFRLFEYELTSIYAGFKEGKESPLPELPVQYGDYSEWQRRRLEAGDFVAEMEYWKGMLAGELPVLELPADSQRKAMQEYEGEVFHLLLPKGLGESLRGLARKNGCTLYMVLLASFFAFLHRYTGAEDIIVGCPVAGRGMKELEGLMGFFVNTLPIRADLSGDPTFTHLLKGVRKRMLEAYSRQNLSFEKIVSVLRPERDLSHSPVYQVLLQLRNFPAGKMESPGIALERHDFGWATAQVELFMDISEAEEGISCKMEYPAGLFRSETIERMAGHLKRLLEGVAEDPDARISRMPLMGKGEQERILVTWNSTRSEYPRSRCIHQIFEERAAEAPGAVAITHGSESLTYGELNARANQLAHLLLDEGVAPGTPVGACMERSPAMVIACLAILKAGGAYVPLDPNDPPARLGVIIGDMAGRIIITRSEYEARLPGGSKLICLDRDSERISGEPEMNPPNRADPSSMAYVIYTSGSTGAPKGVCCPHRGVVRLVVGTNYVRFAPGDTVVHASNPTFDPTTFEVWGALLNGARLLVVDKEALLSNAEFAELLRREGADVLFLTTTLFHLKARDAPESFGSLRELFVGGEALGPSSVRRVLSEGPPKRLINFYGPTENTGFSTFYEVKEVPDGAASIPIGRNISNSTSYILDRHLQPVPVGVKGEIYVSGDGVGLGYFNKPEMTASAFLPNPFSAGGVMYRTGDMGRFLPDGTIEYMGRADLQVKIRGFRVEVGEVEAVLTSHPSVKVGAVVVREGEGGAGRRLVAYVLPNAAAGADGEELRHFMKGRLPDYMVPASFVLLESLPLTPTGKIDRRSLPEPPSAGVKAGTGAGGSRSEKKLAMLWGEVLGAGGVGREDDFFRLGGHSLMAVRLFSLIEKEFGVSLPIATLFRASTVAALAKVIEKGKPRGAVSLVCLRREGRRAPLFLVHAEDGEVYNYRWLVDALGDDQPVYGLKAVGLHEDVELPRTVEEMAAGYVREIKTVQAGGPYHLAGFCSGGVVCYEMAQQLRRAGEPVGLLGILDFEPPSMHGRLTWRKRRALLVRETLFLGADVLRFAKRRRTAKSLKIPSRVVLLEALWLRALGIIPSDQIVLPGEAIALPENWRRVITNLTILTRAYKTKAYGGVVTVFRKQLLPLISSPDPTDGWGRYARGIVTVPTKGRIHGDMLKPPGVCLTAQRVRERIDWHEFQHKKRS